MPSIDQLRNRARSLSDDEFVQIAWLKELTADERAYVRAEMLVTVAQPGDYVVRFGKPVTFWFGLIDGLLKMSNDESQGAAITFTGLAPRRMVWRRHGSETRELPLQRSSVAYQPCCGYFSGDVSLAYCQLIGL